jgi:hypothetical protein
MTSSKPLTCISNTVTIGGTTIKKCVGAERINRGIIRSQCPSYMNIEDMDSELDDGDFTSMQAYELGASLIRDKKARKKRYERITEDDIERINVAGLLLSKYEVANANENNVNVNKNEYDQFGDVYSKVKAMIKGLKLEDIIDYVSAALGGTYFYHIAQRDQYKDYLYNQIRFVIRKVQQPKIPTTNASAKDIPTRDVINDLRDFRLFVEKDGS